MGAGIDLEAAAAEPYHAIEAAAGDRRRGCWSAACSAVLNNDCCYVLAFATGSTMLITVIFGILVLTHPPPSFSVHLTGYDGIDPGRAAQLVSPSFNITLRMNNTCVDSVDLAVTYSGVALGWARVETRDCKERRWARDVNVVARGHGVGLSQGLRDRMASDWRSGAVELDVDVKMYREPDGRHSDTDKPQKMILEKVKIMDIPQNMILEEGENYGRKQD